jgi:hypothetical protein
MRSDLTAEGEHPSIAGYTLLGRDAVAPALRRIIRGEGASNQEGG